MSVEMHYNGNAWQLADTMERSSCQVEVMKLCAAGGGLAEFDLDSGGKIAVLIAPNTPVAFVEWAN